VSRTEWVSRAKCRGASSDVFFPSSLNADRFDLAKSVCATCAVTEECLSLVIDLPEHDDRYGVFGGLTPHERWVLRRERSAG
jgi:WhiB family redox-sensing transcriptional regulator